jgi:flagellar hook assembly protein FlgD
VTLYQNVPNPFNPTTQIRYYLPERSRVRLAVYDVKGRRVATLVDGVKSAGYHNQVWAGRDDNGLESASGVYFYRLVAGKTTLSHKMILLQ